MIIPIKYKPTIIQISPRIRHQAKIMYGEDLASVAIESIKTYGDTVLNTAKATKPKGIIAKLIESFTPKSQLRVSIDVDQNKNIVLSTMRNINDFYFTGKKVPLNLLETLSTHKELDKAVRTSKEGILEELALYNKNKRNFGFARYFSK